MKNIFTTLVIILYGSTFAQEKCTYQGMLVDSLNLPIARASITAFDEKNESSGYTFSDNYGEFKLEMPCPAKYELEIEHLSHASLVKSIDLKKNLREKITLKKDIVSLDAVVAQGRIPIQVKGDTIEYDAASFASGNEENLEQILKKLPGLVVENGKIYYQGKEINSIKVEGREIFGGNQKLISKNLPADAVDKIQLNKKFRANPFANSLQDDEQPELNIVLKEDKKNLSFGNLTLGGDAQKHYDVQSKLFYFSRKTDATLISDFNTYGNEVFSTQDYYQFSGGYSDFAEEGGESSLRSSIGDIGYSSGGNAARMQNHLGALHLGYIPNQRLTVSAFAMATDNETEYSSRSWRYYPEFTQKDVNHNLNKIFSFISRIKMDYSAQNGANIKYRVNFNHQNSESLTDASTFLNDEKTASVFRNSAGERDNYAINQKLSYIKKVGDDDNIGFYFSHIYQKVNPNLKLISTEAPFQQWLNLSKKDNQFQLNQKRELMANHLYFLTIYNHLITNLSNIRIKAGINYSKENLNNTIFDYTTAIKNKNTPTTSNFDFNEYYLDATYTRKWGGLKVDAGLGTHYFKANNAVKNMQNTDLNKIMWLPHLSANYEISPSNRIYFNYTKDYSVPNISDWSPAYEITSYYNLYTGNPELNLSQQNRVSLGYFYSNYFKFINLGVNTSYSWSHDNIRNGGYYNPTAQFTSYYNVPDVEKQMAANIHFSKRFSKNYNLRLNANLSNSDFYSFNNGNFIKASSFSHGYNLRNSIKSNEKIEIDFGTRLNFNDFKNEIRQNKFTSLSPYIESAFVPSKNWLIEVDYSFPNTWTDGKKINSNHNLKASLRIKPARKTYVKLIAGNIFGNNLIVNNGTNDFYTYLNETEILGRYFIAQVRYKF